MAKNFGRMGDNVADIAKELIYMVSGEWPESGRVKTAKTGRMIADPDV